MNIYSILSTKPHNLHYLLRYCKFIQYCEKINKHLPKSTYTEKHHICPQSKDLFPEFSNLTLHKWNSIKLTARQHYIAHYILHKTFGGCQTYAFFVFNLKWSNGNKRNYKVNSKIFEFSRIAYKKRNKLTNPFNNPLFQQQLKINLFETRGVINQFQLPEVKQKTKEFYLNVYGVDHNSKIPFLCIIQNKKTYGKNIVSRLYPELKQYF